MDKLLTIKDVAERIGFNRSTTYQLAQSGKLPAFKLTKGGSWRIREADLISWIAEKAEQAKSGE